MKNAVFFTKIMFYVYSVIVFNLFLISCAGTRQDLRISNFKFDFQNKNYHIRSVNCAQQAECYKELIGDDFVAVDFNQDRIIDKIVMGDVNLSDAQEIYDYGLDLLAQENKLEVHDTDVTQYMETEPCCISEIKTFWTKGSGAFNEFIFVENRDNNTSVTTVAVDQEADGKLDQLVKGNTSLESMQSKYTAMIGRGVESGQLIKEENSVLVKKNR